ncbi:MAG: metalloregulator ArsR/SmtB family transcription factor [Nitrosomonas ureae]
MHRIDSSLHELFQALSDPYRIRMVSLMLRAKSEMCLCELSDSLEEPEYKLSRHLKVLKSSGVLTSTRDGKWIYHSLVKNRHLLAIHAAIRGYPDTGKQFEKDLRRFKKRILLREGGRCRKPSRIMDREAQQKRA